MLKLIEPNETHIQLLEEYKQEFINNNEVINGALFLRESDTIKDFLTFTRNTKYKKTCPKDYVTAHTFLIMKGIKLVGIINTRHELNDYLFNYGGHIGYSIRKTERRKGYAKEALKQACDFLFNEIGLKKILVTCNKNNIASKKTIEANGGILENEIYKNDEETILRYWITKQ